MFAFCVPCNNRKERIQFKSNCKHADNLLFSKHTLHTHPEIICSINTKYFVCIPYTFSLPLLIWVWQERLADELFNRKICLQLPCMEMWYLFFAETKLISSPIRVEEFGKLWQWNMSKITGPIKRPVTASALYWIVQVIYVYYICICYIY